MLFFHKTFLELKLYIKKFKAKKVKEGFNYNSGENEDILTVEQIRLLIENNI